MNKIILIIITGSLFSGCASTAELTPCNDLEEIASSLDSVANTLSDNPNAEIVEGDFVDRELGSVVDELEEIANVENDAILSRNVRTLAKGWDNFDSDQFESALDDVIERIDRIAARDCP